MATALRVGRDTVFEPGTNEPEIDFPLIDGSTLVHVWRLWLAVFI